jgi:hypothetical protein
MFFELFNDMVLGKCYIFCMTRSSVHVASDAFMGSALEKKNGFFASIFSGFLAHGFR